MSNELVTEESAKQHDASNMISGWKEALDVLSKGLLFLGGLCYAAGLMIVNLHYAQFGTAQFELVQAQYVVVGAVWLGLTLLGWLWADLTDTGVRDLRKTWHSASATRRSMNVIYLLALLFSFVPATAILFGEKVFGSEHILASVIMIGHGSIAKQFVDGLRAVVSKRAYSSEHLHGTLFTTVLGSRITIQTPIPIVLLTLYTSSVYVNIAPIFSGGQPRQAIIVIEQSELEALRRVVPSVDAKGIGPVQIIGEGPGYYLIRWPEKDPKIRSTRIRKDHVQVVRYLR